MKALKKQKFNVWIIVLIIINLVTLLVVVRQSLKIQAYQSFAMRLAEDGDRMSGSGGSSNSGGGSASKESTKESGTTFSKGNAPLVVAACRKAGSGLTECYNNCRRVTTTDNCVVALGRDSVYGQIATFSTITRITEVAKKFSLKRLLGIRD